MFDYKINTSSKPIYASRRFLAMYSEYFRTVFFGENKSMAINETTEDEIDHFEEDFETYKLALEILAHWHRQAPLDCAELLSVDKLISLFRLADKFQFPALRDFVKAQLLRHRSKEALDAAVELELHGVKAKLMERVDAKTLEAFMEEKDPNVPLFTPADVKALMKEKARKRKFGPYSSFNEYSP